MREEFYSKLSSSSREVLSKRMAILNNSDLGVHDYGHGIFEVYNFDNKSHHHVLYTNRNMKCDCYDYLRNCEPLGIPCKHILAVERFVESEPEMICESFASLLRIVFKEGQN